MLKYKKGKFLSFFGKKAHILVNFCHFFDIFCTFFTTFFLPILPTPLIFTPPPPLLAQKTTFALTKTKKIRISSKSAKFWFWILISNQIFSGLCVFSLANLLFFSIVNNQWRAARAFRASKASENQHKQYSTSLSGSLLTRDLLLLIRWVNLR